MLNKTELTIVPNGMHSQCFLDYKKLQSQYELKNQEMIDYKTKAHYWENQFTRSKSREESLQTEVEELKAQLRKRDQQLFGRKSEKDVKKQDNAPSTSQEKSKKKRGQQPGSKGHGRRDYSHLPALEEMVTLAEEATTCPCCHLSYSELPGTIDSEVLEMTNVSAYRRVIRKKPYKRACNCKKNLDPQIVVAPPTERLLPKCNLGMTIWAFVLLKKYKYQQPIYRTLEELSGSGLPLAMGTVVDGLKRLLPLFIPIYDAITEHSIAAKHWHADETGWKVFETIEGKTSNRWFLWIFHNKETVVYKMSPTRSSKVLIEYFGEDHSGGTLNVDRYSAYKVIAKSGLFILAFCWAHVRRDFLEHAKAYPHQETWALAWVEKIGNLYHINNQKTQCGEKSKAFRQHDKQLRAAVSVMKQELNRQLSDTLLLPSAKKILKSMNRHWEGLIIFVDYPTIPMDNNQAERGLRPSVLGRKNYYGSGAVWSAELAAVLFSIFETLKLWELNAHTWLLTYFYECSILGGIPPKKIDNYLPWKMTEKQKEFFRKPPKYENYELVSKLKTS